LDRDPVLFITAQFAESREHTHQLVDLQTMLGSVTKRSIRVTEEQVHQQLASAMELMKQGRPGPVHLQLSNEVAAATARGDPIKLDSSVISAQVPSSVRAAIEGSSRPVLLGGLGLEPEGAYDQFQRLAEALASPVILTPKAKGAIPNSHPLYAGTIGLTRADPTYEILEEADLVIAAGFDVVELVKPWSNSAPLVWAATWENDDPQIEAEIELVGSLAHTLTELASIQVTPGAHWGETRLASFRERIPGVPGTSGFAPQRLLEIARRHIPHDAPVTVDVGSHKILACLEWKSEVPNRFFVSNGLSSMGFALPAAIAASQAIPDSPVLCLTGDAGFGMAMGELGVLAELGGAAIVVVFRDDALDLIRSHQLQAGKQAFGTEFLNPDLRNLGEDFGLRSFSARNELEFEEAMQDAISARGPALIEAAIDPATYPTTPTA
jgi:acetolactate synthase-1/2/3 large subunit